MELLRIIYYVVLVVLGCGILAGIFAIAVFIGTVLAYGGVVFVIAAGIYYYVKQPKS